MKDTKSVAYKNTKDLLPSETANLNERLINLQFIQNQIKVRFGHFKCQH